MHTNYSFGLPLNNNFVEFVYFENMFSPHEVWKIKAFWDENKTINPRLWDKINARTI
jgi:hypothetical protein